MSSDSATTTSSRLRQFGLYRTIDARTEEFLKLSRRRQIRQGCACAAVSTAITVTVVVSVLLVYEYGFHVDAELSQPRHRPNWLSMINDSDASFDKNIQKTNININRNTLKLLPILLKAIKQNRYLEKAIEDSQTADEKETTDYPLERNIFTDTRNWIRMPTSRLYAIEYKSSPIVFFKTRNIDNFAKATKIMNSQRIMNYIDRMINEKVGYGPSAQVTSYDVLKSTSSKPVPKITLHDSIPKGQHQKTTDIRYNEITRSKEFDKAYCKCPDNLGEILNKLLSSIQQLLPEKNPNFGDIFCNSRKFRTDMKRTSSTTSRTPTEPNPIITTKCSGAMKGVVPINCRTQPKIKIDDSNFKLRTESRNTNKVQNMITRMKKQNKIPLNDLTNIFLTRNYQNLDLKEERRASQIFEDSTSMKAHIDPTDDNDVRYTTTTRPMTVFSWRKMHPQIENLERFTVKRQGNDQNFGNDFSSKETKKKIKAADSEENYNEMRRTTNSFLQKIKPHIEPFKDKFTISKSKEHFQIEPLKSFSSDHKHNKPEMGSLNFPPNTTVNDYKLYYDTNATKNRKNTALKSYIHINLTEHTEHIDNVNTKHVTDTTVTDISKLKTLPKIENIETFLLEHQGNEQDFGDRLLSASDYKLYDYEEEKAKRRKTTAFNQFLHKLEASQKNNDNFGDSYKKLGLTTENISRAKPHPLNGIENMNGNKTGDLSKTQELLETISDLNEFSANSLNSSLRYNPGSLTRTSNEPAYLLNSMIPQSKPPFLEIRRSDGRREDRDYDEDTNINNFTYD